MIRDGEKWHYLTVKSLRGLLDGIASNYTYNHHFMNCLHSLRTGNRFKVHENASKNHGYCYIEISE